VFYWQGCYRRIVEESMAWFDDYADIRVMDDVGYGGP
jgi:hypothetical protein